MNKLAKLFRDSRLQTIVVLILGTIILSSLGGIYNYTLFSTGDIGYSSGFQGPKAKFAGVRYNGKTYTRTETRGASLASFDTTLKFDPDSWDRGKPNIVGEMTSVFIPEESLSNVILWPGAKALPQEWLKRASVIPNPEKEYSWNISGKTYKMEQWVLRFYLSFSGEWDGFECEQPLGVGLFNPRNRNFYSNLEAWLELDLTPTWYIEGQGTAYFAISKIQVAEFKKTAQDIQGKEVSLDTEMSVSPYSPTAMLYIYYGLWGTTSQAEQEVSYYQGKLLNPALFKNKVYAHFDLNNFGVTSWYEFPVVKTKGDVATIGFDMTVFVIGEWDVKDIQNIPEDFGRTSQTFMPPSLIDYLSDPRVQALLTLLSMAAFFLIIMLVAPGFLIAIIAIFMGGRKRK